MKKIFSALLCIILCSIGAAAQNTDTTANSLLWRITGKGMQKPSYLFGTIHMICSDDYVWTDRMKQALDETPDVCFEMNISDPNVMIQAAAGLMDNSGKKLKDYFTPQQYQLLSKYVTDSLHMDISMFQQLKPVALQTLFGTKSAGCPDPKSYEENIMAYAQSQNKKMEGLEEVKEQIDVLSSIPTDTVIKAIMDDLNGGGDDAKEYNTLISAYKKQDLPALYTLIMNSKDEGDDMALFLDERNKKWIARMSAKMKQQPVFFAVGAGHLWGPNGVINLLKKDGYTVTPIK